MLRLFTEAGLRDTPIGEAMAMTGHRTVATFQGYYQSAAIRRSKVDSMLDTPPLKDSSARTRRVCAGSRTVR